MLIGLLAAILGALGYGIASVLQSQAVAGAKGLAVVRHRAYLIGLSLDGLAWLASLVAAGSLPLFVAQSVLATSVAVTVILAHVTDRTRPGRADVMASGAFVAAVALLAWAAGPVSATGTPGSLPVFLLVGSIVLVVVTIVWPPRWSPQSLAILSGVAFAGTALSARAAHSSAAIASSLFDPAVWALLAFSAAGLVSFTRSLDKGRVGSVTAVLWITEVAVSSVLGMLVLGDSVRPGFIPFAVIGLAGAVAACHLLASSPESRVPADPVETGSATGPVSRS